MDARHAGHRFALAAGLTLLAAVGGQPIAAEAGEAPNAVAANANLSELRADLDSVRQRILKPLLGPVPAETARKLLGTLRPDGSWPGGSEDEVPILAEKRDIRVVDPRAVVAEL